MLRRSAYAVCLILAGSTILPAQDLAVALREQYLGREGLPQERAYAQTHQIAPVPGSESFNWQPFFRLAYRAEDAPRLATAKPVHADCYFVRTRRYVAGYRALPVWDGRVYQRDGRLVVAAYTQEGELSVGFVDERGSVVFSEAITKSIPLLQVRNLHYNPFTGQLWRREATGNARHTIEKRSSIYLPLDLVDLRGQRLQPQYRIEQIQPGRFALVAHWANAENVLATCSLADAGNAAQTQGYAPDLASGCTMATREPTIVVDVPGEIDGSSIDARGSQLVLRNDSDLGGTVTARVQIDGRFDDWRSVPGVADPEGDTVSYLEYNPDTDLLDFKVASDDEYLYFYTRVAGRHGNTAGDDDRYYFYVYIDADRNPATGYVPTRDDNCYYGVALGDDCEAQYEFIGGRFVKTFYGFAGGSTEADVLRGEVTLAPSWYSRHDEQGRIRDGYKVEYIRRAGQARITKDYAEGTSDDIIIALSPDGRECEMRAALSGFLRDTDGRPIIAPGRRIDLAAGVEAAGRVRGNQKWSADSTAVVRGYGVGTSPDGPSGADGVE